MASPTETGHKVDPTPGASSHVPVHPYMIEAEKSMKELISSEDLEEVRFKGGRVYWPEDGDFVRIDINWDRDENQPLED